MPQRGYLTPDAIPAGTTCRTLLIPDDEGIIAQVFGALTELSKEENWEQFGSVTPSEMAVRMWEMCDSFFDAICEDTTMLRPALIRDVKATNTAGGTFTSGTWQTRTLNDLIDIDELGVTLDTNVFTLPSGKWFIRWSAPAFFVDEHQSRLFRTTDTAAVGYGQVVGTGATHVVTHSEGSIIQNISTPTSFRLEHRGEVTRATDGFGLAVNFGTEIIYSQVECWRMADYP